MMPPGFELVVRQNPLNGLRRHRLDDPVAYQLPGQFRTIPLRQGPSDHIRTLAGQLNDIQRHHWGKKPAAGRGVFCRTNRRGHTQQSAAPICGHAVRGVPRGERWRQTSVRQPTATWHAPVWQGQRGSSVSGATLVAWRALSHQWQCVALSDVPACHPPRRWCASVKTNQQPHCQIFRPFSMGTCT